MPQRRLGLLKVMCKPYETRASLPPEPSASRGIRPWKLEAALKCRSMPNAAILSADAHDQAHEGAGDCALRLRNEPQLTVSLPPTFRCFDLRVSRNPA
jgi:hypothetical protein